MGGYDLYGRYYSDMNDAINAEMAQCAAIDADIASRKVADLGKRFYQQQEPTQQDYDFFELKEYVKSLEQRIELLESKINNQ